AYKYDKQEIAQLILDNEEEPEADRGHADRMFPLAEPIELGPTIDRLTLVVGRFVRVGVARWFLIERLEEFAKRLTVEGTLHTYRTFVSTELEEDEAVEADESGTVEDPTEVARLDATPTDIPVKITVVDGRRSLRVHANSVTTARAATRALE